MARHFCALTTNVTLPRPLASHHVRFLGLGGRALFAVVGHRAADCHRHRRGRAFREFLAGAHAMDEHFRTRRWSSNLPVRLGLLDVWYRNFHGFWQPQHRAVPQRLAPLAAYLQQLEMESNGKRVDRRAALAFGTSPVLWGEPGTNGQHAYFQMLHQGTDVVPVEFVAVRKAAPPSGRPPRQAAGQCAGPGAGPDGGQIRCGGHRHFPGNRPSTFLLLDELTPPAWAP
jgi:glucose-6-phosphate isomerase